MLKIAFFAVFCLIALMITSLIFPGAIGVVLPVAALLAGAWYMFKRIQRQRASEMYKTTPGLRASEKVKKQPNPVISRFSERIVQRDVDVAGLISELRDLCQGAGLTETEFRTFIVDAWQVAANAGANSRHMPHILDNLDRARRELSLSYGEFGPTGSQFHEKFRTLFEISNGSVPEFSGSGAGIAHEVLPEDKVVWVEPARYIVAGQVDGGRGGDKPFRTVSRGNILITNHHICFIESTEHQEPENDSFRLRRATTTTPFGASIGDELILERVNPVRQEQSAFPSVKTENVSHGRKYFLIHLDDFKGFTWSEEALQFKHKGHWARKFEIIPDGGIGARNAKVKSVSFNTGDGQFLYTLVTLLKG